MNLKEEIMTKKITDEILATAFSKGKQVIPMGNVATYIPELGKADKNALGLAIVTRDGEKYSVGDVKKRFTIQSISKAISLCVALETFGPDKVFEKVEMEPSGEAFNSIVELDLQSNKPFNPMINSGALAVERLIIDAYSFDDMLGMAKRLCMDPDITVDESVFNSEMKTCSRNRAIGYLLESKGIIEGRVEETLEFYTRMCSLSVTAESLANFGLMLASDGVDLMTGKRSISSETAQTVKTIMLTCGMYDGSGTFAVEVGMPTKSGVGGGLLSLADKKMGIGVYGPALDEKGNCIAGREMLKYLSKELGLHMFHS